MKIKFVTFLSYTGKPPIELGMTMMFDRIMIGENGYYNAFFAWPITFIVNIFEIAAVVKYHST